MIHNENKGKTNLERMIVVKKVLKWIGIAFAILIVIGIVSGNDTKKTQSLPTNTSQKTTIAPKEKTKNLDKKPNYTAAQQQLVRNFEQSIFAIDNSVTPAMEQYQSNMKNFGKTSSIYDAYSSAKSAKDAVKAAKGRLYALQIPKELPDDVKKILEEVKSDMGTSYYCKENAFEYVLKFLDEQKPSDMNKFQEEIAASDQFLLSGTAKLIDAKTKIGIDIAKEAN